MEVAVKDIPGFEGRYAATEDGRIWSYKRGFLKGSISTRGYVRVNIPGPDGKKRSYLVHRLVAMAYFPNPENKATVNHINGVKTDNRTVNLEWATQAENVHHAFETGLRVSPVGEGSNNILTEAQVLKIRKDYVERGLKMDDLAEEYGVCRGAIRLVLSGKNWKHLPGIENIRDITKKRQRDATRNYTPEFVRSLRLLHREGRSIRGLAKELGIPYTLVNYIVNFKTYADQDEDLRSAA